MKKVLMTGLFAISALLLVSCGNSSSESSSSSSNDKVSEAESSSQKVENSNSENDSASSKGEETSSSSNTDQEAISGLKDNLQPIIDGSNGMISSIKPIEDTGKKSDWGTTIVYVPDSVSASSLADRTAFVNDYGKKIQKLISGVIGESTILSFRYQGGSEFASSKVLDPSSFKVE